MIKIIGTIGPASRKSRTIRLMKKAGMNIGRINMKYAGVKEVKTVLQMLKSAGCETLVDINTTRKAKILDRFSFDYLAVSYASSPAQLREIRNILKGKKFKLIAKIETKEGVRNFQSLFKEADGFMIARGDLGRNLPWEYVPIIQKEFIKQCRKKRKFTITATEMLLSMTHSIIPERAEVSDVANAVLDGSDALMLSEETATGNHPILAVKAMRKIINATTNYKRSKSKILHFVKYHLAKSS